MKLCGAAFYRSDVPKNIKTIGFRNLSKLRGKCFILLPNKSVH